MNFKISVRLLVIRVFAVTSFERLLFVAFSYPSVKMIMFVTI